MSAFTLDLLTPELKANVLPTRLIMKIISMIKMYHSPLKAVLALMTILFLKTKQLHSV